MGTGRSDTMEFKKQAIELAAALGSVSKAAEQLGVPDVNIHAWRKTYGSNNIGADKTTKLSVDQEEIKKLRKEFSDLKQAHVILKTAADFFHKNT